MRKKKLSETELKKIGLDMCLAALGHDFVNNEKNECCPFHGWVDEGEVYSFGIAGGEIPGFKFKLGNETHYPYCCIVEIDPYTGEGKYRSDNKLPRHLV